MRFFSAAIQPPSASSTLVKVLLVGVSAVSLGVAGCSRQPFLEAQVTDRGAEPNWVKSSPTGSANTNGANIDVQKLVALGPRVAGTPVMEQASSYLQQAYRDAGYVTEVQTFTYSKFEDQGSTLAIDSKMLEARALRGSIAARPSGRLVAVPNVGSAADFAQVDVEGAIALVRRGEIRFSEKANNAAAAGAIGLVIVNSGSNSFLGSLVGETSIPVLALAGEQGSPLLERASRESLQATLNANTTERQVTGRNVIAHLAGVTQPEMLLGAHYDSVAGSPGANDNASGTAVLLDTARQVAETPLARRVWFVAFDGEEDGLHGSRAFVQAAEPQFLSGLESMLNFDMVGVNAELQVSGSPALTDLVQMASDTTVTAGDAGGSSDHASFAQAEIPVLFFTRGMESNYHSPTDLQVNPQLLNETTQTAINVMQRLLQ